MNKGRGKKKVTEKKAEREEGGSNEFGFTRGVDSSPGRSKGGGHLFGMGKVRTRGRKPGK